MKFLNDVVDAVTEDLREQISLCLTVEGSLTANDRYQICKYAAIWSILHQISRNMPLKDFNTIRKMSYLVEADTRMRIVSIVHALFQIYVSATIIAFTGDDYCGKPNTKRETWLMNSSIGYLVYDFSHKFYFGLITTKIFLGQHILGVISMLIVVIEQKSAIWVVQSLFLVQIHNVWMLSRVVLR